VNSTSNVSHRRSRIFTVLVPLTAVLVLCTADVGVGQDSKGDEIHVNAYHEAFDKQPGHLFQFDYYKRTGLTARGSWKTLSDKKEDELASVTNIYLTCQKDTKTCYEASAEARDYPHADLNFYEVTKWNDYSLEAVDDAPICVKNVLTVEFKTARVVLSGLLRQDDEKTVQACAKFGVAKTNAFKLW
jgi:hypothetical protein